MAKPDEVLLLEARLINLITPQMENMVKNASKGMNRLENNARKTTTKIGNFFKSAGNSIATFAITFGPAALAVGLLTSAIFSLRNAFRAMQEVTENFERTMAKTRAILRPTTNEMAALEKEAKRLGQTTAFTATQAGEAFVEMGKLGFKAGQIIASTASILDLAALSGAGLAESSEVVVKTLNQFNLVAEDSAMLVDLMATAFTSSALDMGKFRESMKFVGTTARLVGLNLKQTTALLAVLADNGIEASMAGTSLNQAFVQLAKPGSKINKVFKQIGAESEDVITKLRLLAKSGIDVGTAFDLLDVRAARAINILIGNLDKFDELSEKFEDVEGNAKEMAKTMLDTVIGAVLLLTSAQETLGISIGEAFGPDKKKRIQFFTEVINRATEFIKRNQEGIGRFAKTLNQFIINTVSFATKVGGIFARNFGSIIEIGKQFFTVFSVAAIILVTKSLIALSISLGTKLAFNLATAASNARLLSLGLFSTATASNGATIGVSRFRAVLATLNINPIILALTALAVGLSLVGIAIRKDAKKGLEDLKQVSDDEVKSLRSLRGEFDRLKQAIKENGDVQKQNFKSGITRLEGTKKQIQAFKGLEFQLDLVSKATKNIIGFDFESTKAKKITIELLKEENLLRNEEAFNIGKANVVKNIAIQKQEELNKKLLEEQKAFENSLNFKKEGVEVDKEKLRFENELEAIRTANLQRSSEGRLQLLAEERTKLLEQARKFGEDETIINREFQQRVTDEIISGIDKRVRVEQIAASKRVKIAEEQSKLDTRIEKKREKEAENDKRRRLDNLQLLSNVTGQALGLFLKSAKAQKTIALGEAIISGIVAVQRALAQPPGPPITFPLAALTGAQAAVNVAAIASQSFRKGGFPKGANTVVRVNEAGQEAILNAEATNTLGTGTIDRLNSGRGGNVTITNEISYSPTLNIGQEEGTDIIDALKRDKDNFVEFFEDLGDKGFFTNKIV